MVKTNLNMTNLFKGYSDYSNDEYKKIWEDAIIVVDSNILLNFYRYSVDTRNKLFKILKKLKKRLWIPFQVGKEFFNNKNNVMISSYNEYDSLILSLNKKLQDAKEEVNKKKNNQLKCKADINKILDNTGEQIERLLRLEKANKKPKFEKNEIEINIYDLFNNSIGEEIIGDEYSKMKLEGLRRFEENIPPGYKDSTKDENGDYYIFYSLMRKAKLDNKDVIFITDDVKEDWFNRVNGEIHGGRYELLNEFFKETGKLLLIYTSDGFVEAYGKNLGKDLADKEIISELKTVRDIRIREVTNESVLIKDYIKKLRYYRDNIDYMDFSEDNTDLFSDLRFVIRRLSISFEPAEKLFAELRVLRRKNYLCYGISNDRMRDFIDKVLEYYDYSIDGSEGVIEKRYYNVLVSLKNATDDIESVRVYKKLISVIKEHLVYLTLRKFKGKEELTDMLSLFLEKIEVALKEHNFDTKEEVIEGLSQIIEKNKELVYD